VNNSRTGGIPPGMAGARKKRRKRKSRRKTHGGDSGPVVAQAISGASDLTVAGRRSEAIAQTMAETIAGTQPAEAANAAQRGRPGDADRVEGARSRRRGRRKRNRQPPSGMSGQAAEIRQTPPGDGAAISGAAEGSTAEPRPGSARKRKGRRRGAKPHAPSQPRREGEATARYLRAPVRPKPDASFLPERPKPAQVQPQAKDAQAGGDKPRRRPVFAALDLGTNNCRLLIAAPDGPERFRVVDAYSRIVRLGEGLSATGRLHPDAMSRAIEALSICAAKLAAHSVAAKRLIATEACRSAENGEEFLAAVRERTGLDLEIVDRATEARLAAEGCGSLMDPAAEGAVLFDIGGGSTELILVRKRDGVNGRISSHIEGWTSLPLGVVSLSERHGGRTVTQGLFDAMVDEVCGHLERFDARGCLDDIWSGGRTHLLGTSGTVTTLAGLHLELPRYDRRRVDGIWLSHGQIDSVIGTIMAMDYEARAKNPCIGRERADLVLAGCAILEAIRKVWPSERLRVADRGLREGILNELMHEAGVWRQQRAPHGRGGGSGKAGSGRGSQ
jgi:exopolyphosphatase / guanosine-5'-triphosphate,3'-diphosphate pyrophosphatase